MKKHYQLNLVTKRQESQKILIPAIINGSVNSLPSFNYKFMGDALSVIADDRIILSATSDKTKPMMVRGAEDSSFTAILSPLLDNNQ